MLALAFVNQVDKIKCINIGDRLSPGSQVFSGIFASVLGTDSNKQDRPVSWESLLISLLKLIGKLVQTPLSPTNETQVSFQLELKKLFITLVLSYLISILIYLRFIAT